MGQNKMPQAVVALDPQISYIFSNKHPRAPLEAFHPRSHFAAEFGLLAFSVGKACSPDAMVDALNLS